MFELNGNEYTLQALQDFAAKKNVDFDTFMSDMKGKGLTEKVEIEKPEKVKVKKANEVVGNDNTNFNVDTVMDYFQKIKENPMPGVGGVFTSKIMAPIAQGLFGGVTSVVSKTPQENKEKETDKYKDVMFVDFLHDMGTYWKKDYKDTEDTEANLALMKSLVGDKKYDDENILKLTKNALEVAKIGLPDEAKGYQETYDKNKEKYGGFTAFFQALGENPTFALGTTVGSAGRMIGTAVNSEEGFDRMLKGGVIAGGTAALTSPFAAPVSIPTATLAGMFGTISGTMEQASTFQELMQEQLKADGKDFTPENIKAFLQNDKITTFKDPRLSSLNITGTRAEIIRKRAINRGITIGLVDTFSGLLGGGVVSKMAKDRYNYRTSFVKEKSNLQD